MMIGELERSWIGAAFGCERACLYLTGSVTYPAEPKGVDQSETAHGVTETIFRAIFPANTMTMDSSGGGGTAATQIIEG